MNSSNPRPQPNIPAPEYLSVRYGLEARPVTDYPLQLCAYLTERHLGRHRAGRLLDLGCGRGEFLSGFVKCGFDGHGVDRERSLHLPPALPVELSDIDGSPLPYEDESFDVVFNKSVLEHVHHITPLLNECLRVLRPGGTFLCMVPDFSAQWSHFYDDWTHVRPFTLTGLRECLLGHGFVIEHAERFRQLPLLWERPYLKPLADVSALLPNRFKRSKWVRFSKEWMLLIEATKPARMKNNQATRSR